MAITIDRARIQADAHWYRGLLEAASDHALHLGIEEQSGPERDVEGVEVAILRRIVDNLDALAGAFKGS